VDGIPTPRGGLLIDSRLLAERCAAIAADKLGTDIALLDMRDVVGYTDWFVIVTGRNNRQTQAIAGEVLTVLKREDGVIATRQEGKREGTWILIDYLDVVVHVFTEETREFYRLDRLWGQVPTEQFAAS